MKGYHKQCVKATQIYCLTFLEVISLIQVALAKIKMSAEKKKEDISRAVFPSEAVDENPFLCLLLLLETPHSLACGLPPLSPKPLIAGESFSDTSPSSLFFHF